MKLNRIYTRIIVSFLVKSLLLSSVSLSSVTVQAESDGSQADFQNEVANQLDATSEAKLDALVPNKAGDWSVIFKENLPWNYFHNAVQRDIRNNNEGMGVRELYKKFEQIVLTSKTWEYLS